MGTHGGRDVFRPERGGVFTRPVEQHVETDVTPVDAGLTEHYPSSTRSSPVRPTAWGEGGPP